MDKDVFTAIGVAADKVAGSGSEDDKMAVATDAGVTAGAIPLVAAAVYRDATGRSRLPVVDKDVPSVIGVAANEVAGSGEKGNKTAVSANAGVIAVAVPLLAAAAHRDAADRACLQIFDKDVGLAIGIAADEVAGIGAEGDKMAVAAHAGRIEVGTRNADTVGGDMAGCTRFSVVDKDVR